MSWATHIYVTRIVAMHFIFTRIGCTLLTCDMYMYRLRHINDPILSSLKMEGIRLLYFHISYILLSFVSSRSHVLHRWELYVPFPIFVYLICIIFIFYVLSIKCSSSGGIRDTCSTRCEN
jgi:hypothetical protein